MSLVGKGLTPYIVKVFGLLIISLAGPPGAEDVLRGKEGGGEEAARVEATAG